MQYHFQAGIVRENNSLIELFSGEKLRIKDGSTSSKALRVNDRAIAAWQSSGDYPRKFRGVRYIDPEAIEVVGCWKRVSQYNRRFPKQLQADPFQAEMMAVQALNRCGIRAEAATDFEDEMLGVDLWAFLHSERTGWVWYPLDVTLRNDMSPHRDDSKYSQAFGKGVIAIRIDFQSERNNDLAQTAHNIIEAVNVGFDDFTTCGQSLLTRPEAMRREVNDIR